MASVQPSDALSEIIEELQNVKQFFYFIKYAWVDKLAKWDAVVETSVEFSINCYFYFYLSVNIKQVNQRFVV